MYRRLRSFLAILAALPLLAFAPVAQQEQGYFFTRVAGSRFGLSPSGCPAINNLGQVVFQADRRPDVSGIYRTQGRDLITVVEDTAGFVFIGVNPSINNRGEVSFAATRESGEYAILRTAGTEIVSIAETSGVFGFFGFDTSMNDRNVVAFTSELDNFDEGLFAGRNRNVSTYYLASATPFAGSDSGPSLNNAGQVAFFEYLDTGGQGIFRIDADGTVTTIVDDSGPLQGPDDPSLNASGLVAFRAALDDTGGDFVEGIWTGDGGPLTTVADATGPFQFFGDPSLNDSGVVAFTADVDGGGQGLFVGPDPVADRVIGAGDRLAGSTVTSIYFCREGLNNSGQLAFLANLANETAIVVRATPRRSAGN